MRSIRLIFAALVLVPAATLAQDVPQLTAVVPTPEVAQPAARPSITVGAFDFGTIRPQQIVNDRLSRQLEKAGIRDEAAFVSAVGVGAADMIIEQLIKTGAFRVLERRQLDAIRQEQSIQPDSITSASPTRVTRARYIVSGSVTRLGFEEKHLGGLAGRLASPWLYGLGGKKNSTFVNLTARIIDAETGEIIASFTGEGESSKGWGVTLFGMGGWGLGGGKVGTDNVRESAIGEATAEAAASIATRIGQLRPSLAP